MIRLPLILIVMFVTVSCGFKPIHKLTDERSSNAGFAVKILNSVSREIVEEVNTNIISRGNEEFSALLTINENLTPLIINTNGTIAKYRIEIFISYSLIKNDNNEEISTGTTRGFAQYDVGTSEISNEDTKKSMVKIATKNAIQLMVSKIQSSISQVDDN